MSSANSSKGSGVIYSLLKGKILHPRILYPARLSFRIVLKCFHSTSCVTRCLLLFLEYCNNFKAVSIYPYSLLTSYFLSQILSYNSSKHCYKISLSLSFCESSRASHRLQNKVPIPFGWHSTIRSQYGTLVIHTPLTTQTLLQSLSLNIQWTMTIS